MGLEVIGNTLDENILTQMAAEHSDDRTSLQIANMIEYLIYLKGILHWNFDRMRGA